MRVRTNNGTASDNPEHGFSLLETAIATVVLMIVGLGAAGAFAYVIRYNSGSADRAASMAIAQATIEKLRNVSFTDSSMNAGETNLLVSDSAGRGYNVKTTITNTTVSGKVTLKKIAVQVVPVNDSSGLNAIANSYYSSVMLVAERCTPVPGTNLN